jgi:acyl-CoA reductase-like NAD-dependent aldehyde dehydrogenase
LVTGGTKVDPGFFYAPTLLAGVDPDSEIAQEEVFGPVLVVIPYDDDDDAVRIANNSIYGLSGAIFSADADRALGLARRIRSGTFSINGGNYFSPDAPFGGFKQSGIGRESGVAGLEEFLESKTYAAVVGLSEASGGAQ